MQNSTDYSLPKGRVLVLRVCKADMTSHNGFIWPTSGPVQAPDWRPIAECGNGLHGWLWGQGDFSAISYQRDPGAKWLVVEADAKSVLTIEGKVKFPGGSVVFCGFWWDALAFIRRYRPKLKGEKIATGCSGHASATGYSGHASATGKDAIACALGVGSTVKAGENGAIVATYFDRKAKRTRVLVGYVGEKGIKAGVEYIVKGNRFVQKKA